MDQIMEYVNPEIAVLIPTLYGLGAMLKKSSFIPDKYIPLTLGAVGVVLSSIYYIVSLPATDAKTFILNLFKGITQGITCAGVSVYTNQLVVVQPKKEE